MIDRSDLRPGSKFSGLFHKAWGQAKESPDYDKQVWKDLEEKIWSRPDPDSEDPAERAKLRPDDYDQRSPEEQWAIDKRLGILDWDGS